MSGYAFHPDAFTDLDEMWEYIAQDSVDAADRVLADIGRQGLQGDTSKALGVRCKASGEFLRNLKMNIHR